MRKITLLFATTLALGACVRTSTNPATGGMDVDVESPTKQGEDWKAKLVGTPGYTQLSGEAKATVVEGKTNASVTLMGGMSGGVHPWMIHDGTCAAPGSALGTMNMYPPLTFGSDMRANVNTTLDMRLNEAKPYIVAVHASMSDMTIVACGNLDD